MGFAVLGLLVGLYLTIWIKKQDPGNKLMMQISGWVREGAFAFLKREYSVMAIFVLTAGVFLYMVLGWWAVLCYVIGASCSSGTGFLGMNAATLANCRTTQAATCGKIGPPLKVAFRSGTVMGIFVVSFGVLFLAGLFNFFAEMFGWDTANINQMVLPVLAGYPMGASTGALFARVGGGIYTKAADVGADLAGKNTLGIPEDDPRNPAVIADNVGDNVGDVAGMGADLFESYVGAIYATMIPGALIVTPMVNGVAGDNIMFVLLPLVLCAVGIPVSILGTLLVRIKDGGNPQTALNTGVFGAGILMLLVAYPIVTWMLPETFMQGNVVSSAVNIYWCIVVGLVAGNLIGYITEYFTASDKAPVYKIALSCETGAGPCISTGLANGWWSAVFAILVLLVAMKATILLGGNYGLAIAAVGMLCTIAIVLGVDAYGPVADNAGGLAEMAKLPDFVRKITDALDSCGNTTAAQGKGYAIGSAGLTALALFSAYCAIAQLDVLNAMSMDVIIGIFLGMAFIFLFVSMMMTAVGDAASEMAKEVIRQFTEIVGLREGTTDADHAKCVDIATKASIKKMILPVAIAIFGTITVGYFGGFEMLGGLQIGTTIFGVGFAIFMANAGGSWDNAKKLIESGAFGPENGKGSDMHKAAVTGDTVGDPFKDTCGPALNIVVKLVNMVSVVFALSHLTLFVW
jgi:K(+)-stimulated pyrophosphate-energized sodium pump